MPAMVRPDGKAKNIAYLILGVPQNMRKNKNKRNVNKQKGLEGTFIDR